MDEIPPTGSSSFNPSQEGFSEKPSAADQKTQEIALAYFTSPTLRHRERELHSFYSPGSKFQRDMFELKEANKESKALLKIHTEKISAKAVELVDSIPSENSELRYKLRLLSQKLKTFSLGQSAVRKGEFQAIKRDYKEYLSILASSPIKNSPRFKEFNRFMDSLLQVSQEASQLDCLSERIFENQAKANPIQAYKEMKSLLERAKALKESLKKASHQEDQHPPWEIFERLTGKLLLQSKKLERMRGTIPIFEGAKQVEVLPQTGDGTVYGHQSCGYHALKNAMIMIYANDPVIPATLETMFSDKLLFSVFDKKYVQPYLLGRKAGHYDASPPLLRQIIHDFTEDPIPPQELIPLQQSLKKRNDHLAIFNMSTTTGDQSGVPLSGLFDEAGLKDAMKFFDFAKSEEKGSFTAIFGNEAMGHWFTINIFKEESGKMTYYCCDSLGEKHDITGRYSPFGKMVSLLEQQISQPKEFIRKAFEDIGSELERKAGWVSYSGSVSEENKQLLMNDTPNQELAIPGLSNGSPRDQLIYKCLSSLEVMERCGWLESSNVEQQSHVDHLVKLLTFFRDNLDPNSSHMPQIVNALNIINEKRKHDYINQAMQEVLSDIDSIKATITPHQYELARVTFEQLHMIFKEKSMILQGRSENERLGKINALTNSAGAETGFSSGNSLEEAEKHLTRKLQLALVTYQKSKEKGLFKELVQEISRGDPCLTARFGRIEEFLGAKIMGFDLEENMQEAAILVAPETAIAEALYSIPDEYLHSITPQDFIDNEAYMEHLIAAFKLFGNGDAAQPFRELLKNKGFIDSDDKVDWKALMPSLVLDPIFARCLVKAKTMVI